MIRNDVARWLARAIAPKPVAEAPEVSGGTVTRVDVDGTVWVQLFGSDDETPCATKTAAARPGDVVTVTIGGGRATVDGNVSTPATDDARAEEAHELAERAIEDARTSTAQAERRIAAVGSVADEAQAVASATNQHFFADESGIHVTEAEGDATIEHNILINSLGILLRHAVNPLVSITQSAIAFYDGLDVGQEGLAAHIVASFGSTLARVGKVASNHIDVTSTAVQFFADATNKVAEIGVNNGVSFLHLIDRYRYVSASTGGSGGSTKDNITVGSYGVNNSHHAGVNLIAYGTSGQATLRVHDDNSEGASLDVTPDRVVVPQGVDLYARKDVYVDGTLSIAETLSIASPLAISSGGTGITDFGTIVQSDVSTAVSVATATNKSITYVQLPAGTWMLMYGVRFATNSTGRREAVLGTTADTIDGTWQRRGGEQAPAASGGATMLSGSYIHTTTGSSTLVYLTVYQSSGGALDVTGTLQAIKVG